MEREYNTYPTPKDSEEKPYSHSILTAVCTCPVWGIVRYDYRKVYSVKSRSLALEFGSAFHEVFAAVRLWQVGAVQGLEDHMRFHGQRLFGERFEECLEPHDEPRDQLIALGFNIVHTGEFYDDPRDNIRTVSNLEEGIIKYVDEQLSVMEKNPIWVRDKADPESDIGIEYSFDCILERIDDGVPYRVRYIGTIDGLIELVAGKRLRIDDNKTASRLDDAWIQSFDISHQLTGYNVGATTMTGIPCFDARVLGIKNKLVGKSEDYIPIAPLERTQDALEKFIDWTIYAKGMYDRYRDDIEEAPRFTHSCNRYFRPCALIPFCGDTPEGRAAQLEQMVEAPLSPSEQVVLDRVEDLDK